VAECDLIEFQKAINDQFLMVDEPWDRLDEGLAGVSNRFSRSSRFPECDAEFVLYEFENQKFDVEECRQRGSDLTRRSR